ncbi:GNAT family N-acetyltransferase [Sphingomonas sp.]|uniref:GNAT family N-acetyltransferase n=1 Tax=Sphingomonas sp. TaxID=28214 RepID=UPI0035BC23E7
MFARTKRLTLRPAWPEDAPAIAAGIAHEPVVRMLARVPQPYTLADAEAFVARPRGAEEPVFAIETHDDGLPRLIGGIGIHPEDDGLQLGYWIAPEAWGRGYATEAGHAVIAMARQALPVRRLTAWHFVDNPASGRVLTKLGFRPTGEVTARRSAGRGREAAATGYALDLGEDRTVPLPIAA